jgi:hypothetical protein
MNGYFFPDCSGVIVKRYHRDPPVLCPVYLKNPQCSLLGRVGLIQEVKLIFESWFCVFFDVVVSVLD